MSSSIPIMLQPKFMGWMPEPCASVSNLNFYAIKMYKYFKGACAFVDAKCKANNIFIVVTVS